MSYTTPLYLADHPGAMAALHLLCWRHIKLHGHLIFMNYLNPRFEWLNMER